jgi:hypothetical protein
VHNNECMVLNNGTIMREVMAGFDGSECFALFSDAIGLCAACDSRNHGVRYVCDLG